MKKKTAKGVEYTAMRYVSTRSVETERGKEYYYSYTPCKRGKNRTHGFQGSSKWGRPTNQVFILFYK